MNRLPGGRADNHQITLPGSACKNEFDGRFADAYFIINGHRGGPMPTNDLLQVPTGFRDQLFHDTLPARWQSGRVEMIARVDDVDQADRRLTLLRQHQS